MLFQEPKIEFVALELKDIITESNDPGQQIDICTGNDDQDCSGGAA